MMGHRERLKGGSEYDLAGSPQHRWRKYLISRSGKWTYWKNRINRRNRRETKQNLNKEMNGKQRPATLEQG